MEQLTTQKARPILTDQVVATATATKYPTFPTGPTGGKVTFLGDFRGARIASFVWKMADLDTFTAADCTILHSADGVTWHTLKAATQKVADGSEIIYLVASDPQPLRFLCAEIDMTGTPGTSTHTVTINYDQLAAARGGLADGIPDRSN